jgi:hypothetical protein
MQVDPEQLPHWIRVAFAARCARRVQALFAEAWPEAIPARVEAIERAISLAEQSAVTGHACAGLPEAMREALIASGRALIPHHYPALVGDDEPAPTGSDAALVASFAARVAEKAAEAAAAAPGDSGRPAGEAFYFALDAIRAAGCLGLVEVLEAEFEAVARQVPPRPWWRFW